VGPAVGAQLLELVGAHRAVGVGGAVQHTVAQQPTDSDLGIAEAVGGPYRWGIDIGEAIHPAGGEMRQLAPIGEKVSSADGCTE
jgi:hypothetical protein